jgi:hypothetical protein
MGPTIREQRKKGDRLSTVALPPSLFELRRDKPYFLLRASYFQRASFPEVPGPRTGRFFRLDEVLHVALELQLVVARLTMWGPSWANGRM